MSDMDPREADDALLSRLVDDHYAPVYRFALRLCGSASDADDVVQQTFLTAQRKLSQLADVNRARAWLFTIAKNTFLKSQRRAERSRTSLDTVEEPSCESVVPDFDDEALQNALEALPDEYRATLLLFYFRELSYKEIAESLRIPIGTVMSRLSRAKAALRRSLVREDTRGGEPHRSSAAEAELR